MDEEAKFQGVLSTFNPLSVDALGRFAPAQGLEEEVREASAALARGVTVLFSGKAGVGKTTLIREVQRRILGPECPAGLRGTRIYVTSVTHLLAGTIYAGWWQTKLAAITHEVALARLAGLRPLVWLTDFGNLLRECRGEKGKPIGDDLMAFVDSGELWIGGEVTPDMHHVVMQDPRWAQRVETLDLAEPSARQTRAILEAVVAPHRPRAMGGPASATVRREQDLALDQSLLLAKRFMAGIAQPGASIRLVERAMAGGALTTLAVQQAVCELTGLPGRIVRDDLPMEYAEVVRALSSRVIGQPEAVDAAANALLMVKAGLTNPRRPLAVFGFFGPSGVGKTELAKAIAEELFGDEAALVRIDMSEFVGGTAAVQFANSVVRKQRGHAMSVCLFDEVEKADFNSLDVLLQVMSDGLCTSESGERADLRQSIIVLTSNVGFGLNEPGPRRAAGFPGSMKRYDDPLEEVERVEAAASARFRPEFLGRIDRMIVFRRLGDDAVKAIVRRELGLALNVPGIIGRDLDVRHGGELVDEIAGAGCDPRYGARPLVASIRGRVSNPLARWIAARPSIRSLTVHLSFNAAGELTIDAVPASSARIPLPSATGRRGRHEPLGSSRDHLHSRGGLV